MVVVNLAIFKDDKILVVRDREGDFWTLPGGKKEKSDKNLKAALVREISEELPKLKWNNVRYFDEFFGLTPHSREFLIVELFFGDLIGGSIKPGREVTQSRWVGEESSIRLTKTTKQIINQAFLHRL